MFSGAGLALASVQYYWLVFSGICANSSPCVGEHILGDEDSDIGLC